MSVINNDKKALDGRSKTLQDDAKASLRDQIVLKLTDKLIEDGIGQKVSNLWQRGNANRVSWLERMREYLLSWDEHLIGDTTGAYDGSSNIHIPITLIVAKTLHARFLQALLGIDPPFYVRPRTEAFVDRVQLISDLMRYAIYEWGNHYRGVEEVLDKWIWAWITQGSGTIKWRWDCEYTSYLDVVDVEEEGPPKMVKGPDGRDQLQPRKRMVEKEVEVTKKTFEGPVAEFVEVEDLLIIGGGGDPDRADAVIHCSYLDSSELWTLVDRGVFREEAVREIIEKGPDVVMSQVTGAMKYQRTIDAGQAQVDHDQDHDRYRILEAHLRYDVDGSGIFSDIVVWVHERTRAVCKATYLRRMNKAGERPFKKIDFHLRNDQEYGVGIVEMMYPLAKEMDAIHNMRIDFGLISVMPFGFYRASSSINPETIQLEPGALIPVDNPATDVYFPNLGNRTVFGMQEEQALQQMIDRLTSISDLNLGVIGGQGATRTATGTRALVGEASANLDVYLRRMNRGWKGSLEYLLHMLQQRAPSDLSFRLTGEDGNDYWHYMKGQGELQGDYDIEVSPNTSSSNSQITQERAREIMQITANPLDIQLQIIRPENRYEAIKSYLKSLGEKAYGRYITKPQGYSGPLLTPEEEANRVLRGIPVDVRPDMDHDGFIAWFDNVYKNDDLLGLFNEQETVLLAQQVMKHQQMKLVLKQLQAQAQAAQQMRANSANASQQAPVGQNPMAGGPSAAQTNPGPAAGTGGATGA